MQRRAEKVAKDEAAKALEGAAERVERAALAEIERLLPTLIEQYGEFARQAASEDVANAIAGAQDDENQSNSGN